MKLSMLTLCLFVLTFITYAQLPKLSVSPSADNLPISVGLGDDDESTAYIDADGDTEIDFVVYFSSYSNSNSYSYYFSTWVNTGDTDFYTDYFVAVDYSSRYWGYYLSNYGSNNVEFYSYYSSSSPSSSFSSSTALPYSYSFSSYWEYYNGDIPVFLYGQLFDASFFSSLGGTFYSSGYLGYYREGSYKEAGHVTGAVAAAGDDNIFELNNGYIALKYWDSASTSSRYGWLGVEFNTDASSPSINFHAAYVAPESGSASVVAGIGGAAVPIPFIASIFTMLLIGGAAFLRKRKK